MIGELGRGEELGRGRMNLVSLKSFKSSLEKKITKFWEIKGLTGIISGLKNHTVYSVRHPT